MTECLGIDTRKFVRKGTTNDFVAVIGMGISVKNYDYFMEKYIEIITGLLNKIGIKPEKNIYKSYDLKRLGITHDFYKEFYKKTIEHIDDLHFFSSYFQSTTPSSKVKIFPYTSCKEISFINFISSYLEPSFPHICFWSLIDQEGYSDQVFLDNFNGKVTNAWKEIESRKNFEILPNGDRSNALISTADILLNYFDNELYQNNGILNNECIEEIFDELNSENKFHNYFISNACLYNIVPLSESLLIPVHQRFSHPVFFLFKEKIKSIKDKTIENSPLFKKIVNMAFKKRGCFKFFDTSFDYNIISNEDYFIYFGEEGEKTVEMLKNLGYNFKSMNFSELKKI